MKIIGMIQARMDSKRLPGKVMMDIYGKPIIWHIYQRMRHAKLLDQVVIVTGEYKKNKEISKFAKENNIPIFSGDESDLIDRIYKAALKFDATAIVRITADCPLVDPKLIDKMISVFKNNYKKYEIVSNTKYHTFPHGLDVEIYSITVLKNMWNSINKPEMREWFPLYAQSNFDVLNVKNSENLTKFRLTVDYIEDFNLIKKIYEELYPTNRIFNQNDIINLLKKNPELQKINLKHIDKRNIDAPKL